MVDRILNSFAERKFRTFFNKFDTLIRCNSLLAELADSLHAELAELAELDCLQCRWIMQEEHHEPNQPVEDHAVTPSPNLDISNAVGLTSATVPTSSQKQLVDSSEERVYNIVKTTPPAKKCKPDLKTDEAKEWLKSFIIAITSRYKKNVSAPKKTQINFFRSLVAYLFLFVGVAGMLDKEISNITVHELAQAVVHMKDYPDDEDISFSVEPNESK